MTKTGLPRTGSERALRSLLEEIVDQRLAATLKGGPVATELKSVKGTIERIERRLESLVARVGARRLRKGTGGSPGRPPLHTGCSEKSCKAEHYALGLCSRHYQQARRAGSLPGAAETAPRATKARAKASAKRSKGAAARRGAKA